jgi:hypothetical protein
MIGPSTIEGWLQKLHDFEHGNDQPGLAHPDYWHELAAAMLQLKDQIDAYQRVLWIMTDNQGGRVDITPLDLLNFPRDARLLVERNPERFGYIIQAFRPKTEETPSATHIH